MSETQHRVINRSEASPMLIPTRTLSLKPRGFITPLSWSIVGGSGEGMTISKTEISTISEMVIGTLDTSAGSISIGAAVAIVIDTEDMHRTMNKEAKQAMVKL